MSKMWRALVVGVILSLASTLLSSSAAESAAYYEAPQQAEPSAIEDLGYGFGSVLANLFYMPAKVTYAGLGLFTSGLGYVLSGGNTDAASNIMNPAVRGNYVVTPRHLKGEEPLIFVGPSSPPEPQAPERAARAPRLY